MAEKVLKNCYKMAEKYFKNVVKRGKISQNKYISYNICKKVHKTIFYPKMKFLEYNIQENIF